MPIKILQSDSIKKLEEEVNTLLQESRKRSPEGQWVLSDSHVIKTKYGLKYIQILCCRRDKY